MFVNTLWIINPKFSQQALTKVPTNVQHFADMGVYKQLKKKTHLTKEVLFPHLPGVANGGVATNGHADVHRDEARKVFKSANAHNINYLKYVYSFLFDTFDHFSLGHIPAAQDLRLLELSIYIAR